MTGKRGLWGFRYDTTHPKINHYKMHFRFLSAKWNAATRYSARPFTTKTGARVHFFCLNSPRNRGWYQARVHPFSSGNGKGDLYIYNIYKTLLRGIDRHSYHHEGIHRLNRSESIILVWKNIFKNRIHVTRLS